MKTIQHENSKQMKNNMKYNTAMRQTKKQKIASVETWRIFTSTCKQRHVISFKEKTWMHCVLSLLLEADRTARRRVRKGEKPEAERKKGGMATATVYPSKKETSKMEWKSDCSSDSEVSYSAQPWRRLSPLNRPIVWTRPPWHRPFHDRRSPGAGSRWWLQCNPPPPPPPSGATCMSSQTAMGVTHSRKHKRAPFITETSCPSVSRHTVTLSSLM